MAWLEYCSNSSCPISSAVELQMDLLLSCQVFQLHGVYHSPARMGGNHRDSQDEALSPREVHTRASWEVRLEQMESGPGGACKPAWGAWPLIWIDPRFGSRQVTGWEWVLGGLIWWKGVCKNLEEARLRVCCVQIRLSVQSCLVCGCLSTQEEKMAPASCLTSNTPFQAVIPLFLTGHPENPQRNILQSLEATL